jgi:hypothetical protein
LWRDDTKFKNLGTQTDNEEAALASFGVAAGRAVLAATPSFQPLPTLNADALRAVLLRGVQFVDGAQLLSFCWSIGIPVIQLRVFPLTSKRMHAVTVRVEDRYAILLAYILAHELGHVLLGHLANSEALLDLTDPLTSGASDDVDDEEVEADRFALTVLTGEPAPQVLADSETYNATELAAAAIRTSSTSRIDPGVLALCLGYATGRWRESVGALKIIPPGELEVGQQINDVADRQFDWDGLSSNTREYLERLIGQENES